MLPPINFITYKSQKTSTTHEVYCRAHVVGLAIDGQWRVTLQRLLNEFHIKPSETDHVIGLEYGDQVGWSRCTIGCLIS
jgi:hypothetical protein